MTENNGQTALLIVDVQNAPFMRKQYDGKELLNGEILLATIGSLIGKARASRSPVVYVQYTEGL